MDKIITDGLEQKGFVTFGLAEGGFTYLMSQVPIETMEDLEGQKMWIPEGDVISRTTMKVADQAPVVLPLTDVLTGLQTGLINALASTPSFAIALQWHTKVKYLTEQPVVYSIGAFLISQKAFEKLKSDHQAIVREELENVFQHLNKINRQDNISAMQALENNGIKFIKPGPAASKKLQAVAEESAEILIQKGLYTREIIEEVDHYLTEFRKEHTTNTKN